MLEMIPCIYCSRGIVVASLSPISLNLFNLRHPFFRICITFEPTTHKHSQKINTKVISHFSRKRYRFVIFTFSCCCCCSSLRCCVRVKCVENNFKSWLIVYIYIELCLSFLMSIKNCTLACVQHFKCTHFKFFYYFFSALFFLTLSAIYIYFNLQLFLSFPPRDLFTLAHLPSLFCFHSQFAKHTNTSTDTWNFFCALFLFAAIKKSSNKNVKEEMKKKIISFNIQSKYTLFEIWDCVWVWVRSFVCPHSFYIAQSLEQTFFSNSLLCVVVLFAFFSLAITEFSSL